ncbi:MAG: S-methyl-5-thioribose-1-phosphate isomerase [Promethearchaeota archaeon]
MKPLEWKREMHALVFVDQRALPTLKYVTCETLEDVASAIKNMVVRGAPAIAVAGVYGLALHAFHVFDNKSKDFGQLLVELKRGVELLKNARPTAVNLSIALDKILQEAHKLQNLEDLPTFILREAEEMIEEDRKMNLQIAENGLSLIQDNFTILTHCHTGGLAVASGEYGTAQGIIKLASERKQSIRVFATETRPYLQGRITAFELAKENVDVTIIPDNAVGILMYRKIIDCVIVGADRVLGTGHVFNKIGTYALAVLANQHQIPFYVALPVTTFDFNTQNLEDIIIEERNPNEVRFCGERQIVPDDVPVLNPAFDITPPELITALICDKGIIYPPFDKTITA